MMSVLKGQIMAVCESILTTLEHTIRALLQNKPHSRETAVHIIPQSLLVLEAQMHEFWDRIDVTWRETLAARAKHKNSPFRSTPTRRPLRCLSLTCAGDVRRRSGLLAYV